VVSQIRMVAPGIKLRNSDPSMERRIKIFRPFDQVFEPYGVMFRELKGGKKVAVRITVFLRRK